LEGEVTPIERVVISNIANFEIGANEILVTGSGEFYVEKFFILALI
jgi:hypothetical protein